MQGDWVEVFGKKKTRRKMARSDFGVCCGGCGFRSRGTRPDECGRADRGGGRVLASAITMGGIHIKLFLLLLIGHGET